MLLVVIRAGNCTDWKRSFGITRLRFFIILAKVVDFLILFQVSVEETKEKTTTISQDMFGLNLTVSWCSILFPRQGWFKIHLFFFSFKSCKQIFHTSAEDLQFMQWTATVIPSTRLGHTKLSLTTSNNREILCGVSSLHLSWRKKMQLEHGATML